MSVSSMKRLTVFAHKEEADELVRRLVRLRCVDVSSAEPEAESLAAARCDYDAERSELERSVARINDAMTALNLYSVKRRSLIRPRHRVKLSDFVEDGSAVRAREVMEATLNTVAKQSELKNEIAKRRSLMAAVRPYEAYDAPLGVTETECTHILLGVLPPQTDLDVVGRKLYAAGAIAELFLADGTGKYIGLNCHKSDTDGVLSILSEHGFLRASLGDLKGTAAESLRELRRSVERLEIEARRLEQELRQLADRLEELEILYDVEQTELTATVNKQKMLSTDRTVYLVGWVPGEAAKRVSELLERHTCAYELTDPTPEDNPPILLRNNGFAANFEWVLGMYSYPAYGRFDPTFIMSIFYFIIFGIMFADAGYGLVLTLACFGGVLLLKPGRSMERFLKMFGYCGISCIVFGVLFGAYFGDLPLAFMKNMLGVAEADLPNLALLGSSAANVALLFDPLQNPMAFLVLSLAVGAVHLIAGMAVKFYLLCRDGQVWDAIFDIGAYWVLFAGIALIFLVPTVGIWVTVLGAAVIVLTHGRAEKSIIMKILKGLLGLYDLISYVSDLLSYSRILALGLAAGVIAQVVNILGTMGGPSVGGFIALVIAFVIGHLLNIAINVLGTFVHTSRLQYIEFFNKFYEDGGVPFEPAEPSEKYTEE